MASHTNVLVVCSFFGLFWISQADEFKPGSAYPSSRVSAMNLTLSTFINQRSLVTDWSLVVLLRGEKQYILSDKSNRHLLSEPAVEGDMVLLDEVATAFLGWRRQHPETESGAFWKSNPQLRLQTVRYMSPATKGSSSASRNAASDFPEPHFGQPSVSPLLPAHLPPTKNAPAQSKVTPAPATPVPEINPPASLNRTTATEPTRTSILGRESPMWPWVVGIAGLVMIVALVLRRRA